MQRQSKFRKHQGYISWWPVQAFNPGLADRVEIATVLQAIMPQSSRNENLMSNAAQQDPDETLTTSILSNVSK